MSLPKTPAEVAEFIGNRYASLLQAGPEFAADDRIVVSVRNLMDAFGAWAKSHEEPLGSTSEAAELKSVVADAINVLCANGDLPDAFEDVADWVVTVSMPTPAQIPTDAECDQLLEQAIDAEAKKHGIPVACLNTDIAKHTEFGRAVVRIACGITNAVQHLPSEDTEGGTLC